MCHCAYRINRANRNNYSDLACMYLRNLENDFLEVLTNIFALAHL